MSETWEEQIRSVLMGKAPPIGHEEVVVTRPRTLPDTLLVLGAVYEFAGQRRQLVDAFYVIPHYNTSLRFRAVP